MRNAFQDNSNRFGVDAVLFAQDALGQGFRRVLVFDRDEGLHDDRAGVEIFVHEVHGAAGKFHAVFEGLALRFEAGKGGQQRGMNIQDAIRKGGDEIRREQAHVAREADEVHILFVQRGDDQLVIGFALEALRGNHLRRDAAGAGFFNSGRAFAIAEDDRDFSLGNAAGGDAIGQRFEIGAAA